MCETIYNCKLIMQGTCRSCNHDSDFNVAFVTNGINEIVRSELTCRKCKNVQKYLEFDEYGVKQ